MRYGRALMAAAGMHLRLYATHPLRLSQVILRPLQIALTLLIVLRLGSRTPDMAQAVVGAAMVGIWTAMLATATFTILRERFYYGTFMLVAGTPSPLVVIFAGFLLGELVISLPALAVGFLTVLGLAGTEALPVAPLSFAVSLLLGGACLLATCLCVAPLMTLSPAMTRWYNALEYPTWILGGFLFPITVLPAWVRPLSYLFGPYWVTQSLRAAVAGAPAAGLWGQWGIILALTLVQGLAAIWLFDRMGRRTRASGELATE